MGQEEPFSSILKRRPLAVMVYEKRFFNLQAAVDHLHAHFRERSTWCEDAEALGRLQLVVHEWIANLMQHAHFGGRRPEVHVCIWRRDAKLCCTIEDNSRGFDLTACLDRRPDLPSYARTLPSNGMGLLMLRAGTEQATYHPVDRGRHRLRLTVGPRRRLLAAAGEEDTAAPPG